MKGLVKKLKKLKPLKLLTGAVKAIAPPGVRQLIGVGERVLAGAKERGGQPSAYLTSTEDELARIRQRQQAQTAMLVAGAVILVLLLRK